MWHKPCRTFHPWCPCIKTRCLLYIWRNDITWTANCVYIYIYICIDGSLKQVSAQRINSLWPSNATWRHRTGSTLFQVMDCCLTPRHYLNQRWLIIGKVHWQSSKANFARDTSAINHWNKFEDYLPKISFKYPIGQWVTERKTVIMMTSSNGNIFRVTGPLCGEFTGHRWIALTKVSDAELWCFLWSAPEQTVE